MFALIFFKSFSLHPKNTSPLAHPNQINGRNVTTIMVIAKMGGWWWVGMILNSDSAHTALQSQTLVQQWRHW